jgi:hypothetical protein
MIMFNMSESRSHRDLVKILVIEILVKIFPLIASPIRSSNIAILYSNFSLVKYRQGWLSKVRTKYKKSCILIENIFYSNNSLNDNLENEFKKDFWRYSNTECIASKPDASLGPCLMFRLSIVEFSLFTGEHEAETCIGHEMFGWDLLRTNQKSVSSRDKD